MSKRSMSKRKEKKEHDRWLKWCRSRLRYAHYFYEDDKHRPRVFVTFAVDLETHIHTRGVCIVSDQDAERFSVEELIEKGKIKSRGMAEKAFFHDNSSFPIIRPEAIKILEDCKAPIFAYRSQASHLLSVRRGNGLLRDI